MRPERVVLGVVSVVLAFVVVCPPIEYGDHGVHFWLWEALRLETHGPYLEAEFAGRLLLMEVAVLWAVVGLSLLAGRVFRKRSGTQRFTRADRVLVVAVYLVMLLMLFPPFLVEEGSWANYEYISGGSHVAYRVVIASERDGEAYSDVYLKLLVGEVAVVILVAGVLMVLLRQKRKPAQKRNAAPEHETGKVAR
jgi:hypothetical protein